MSDVLSKYITVIATTYKLGYLWNVLFISITRNIGWSEVPDKNTRKINMDFNYSQNKLKKFLKLLGEAISYC